eukprot:6660713-Prymnesium_polylepis.1
MSQTLGHSSICTDALPRRALERSLKSARELIQQRQRQLWLGGDPNSRDRSGFGVALLATQPE